MIILGIDTSCDDTSIAILESKNIKLKVLSSVVSSQTEIHQEYGGVYPGLAKREHKRNLPIALKKAFKKAKIKLKDIDFIALTIGPGLEPCLWEGINFAKEIAKEWQKPIIPVNHIEAHIVVNLLPQINSKSKVKNQKSKVKFPAIALVVSGGNTQLILMEKIGKYRIIGETRDDAAGECLDKTARVLGLPYPGGPNIAAEAAKFSISNFQFSIKLPRPMFYTKDFDFSFSGLKTAVLYTHKKQNEKTKKSKKYIQEMAKEIQQSVIDVLIKKTIAATKQYKAKTIMLGGGVASNIELRKQFQVIIKKQKLGFKFHVPSFKLCSDNAVMIAIAGYFNREKASKNWQKLKANANLRI